jgi:hypothetical protein
VGVGAVEAAVADAEAAVVVEVVEVVVAVVADAVEADLPTRTRQERKMKKPRLARSVRGLLNRMGARIRKDRGCPSSILCRRNKRPMSRRVAKLRPILCYVCSHAVLWGWGCV